jgi:hypothetical protein
MPSRYILHQLAAALPDNPEFGCTDRVAETRELVIAKKTPFIMPYRWTGSRSKSCASIRPHSAGRTFFEMIEWEPGSSPYPSRGEWARNAFPRAMTWPC